MCIYNVTLYDMSFHNNNNDEGSSEMFPRHAIDIKLKWIWSSLKSFTEIRNWRSYRVCFIYELQERRLWGYLSKLQF